MQSSEAAQPCVTRGMFVLFEGIVRSGKTTQANILVHSLHSMGLKAELFKFPDRTTPIGKMIDAYLTGDLEMNDQAMHLLFSANRWECADQMRRKLDEGTHLVVDRYSYSGAAFTAAKGYDISWCLAPDSGLPVPDIVFYMHMPVVGAMKRGGFGEERYEKAKFQEEVRRKFEELMTQEWVCVDATKSVDEVSDDIVKIMSECLNELDDGL